MPFPELVADVESPNSSPADAPLLTVKQAAHRLSVSQTWVRRHSHELGIIRCGGLVRFDGNLLSKQFTGTIQRGNSLKPERKNMYNRYQRGSVYIKGKKGHKVWYGKFREDVMTTAGMKRKQRVIRLGTMAELPTKNAARDKLAQRLGDSTPPTVMDITFKELAERWEKAEGPAKKNSSLLHYRNAIRMYVNPVFEFRKIATITREDIQLFLAEKAKKYSRSALRSMRTVLSMTLGWAVACRWLPANPCTKVQLPREAGGKRVFRSVWTPHQVIALVSKLEEPYATLVLLLVMTGLRIGEAIGVQWSDIDSDNILCVSRRVYNGKVDAVKSDSSARRLPLDHTLADRIRALRSKFPNGEWVFQSRAGCPINPGNALKRYIRPAAQELGIRLGGYHDFRHTLSTTLRRAHVHPKVVSDILGHKKVNLAMDVYDRTEVADFIEPLAAISKELVASGSKMADAA